MSSKMSASSKCTTMTFVLVTLIIAIAPPNTALRRHKTPPEPPLNSSTTTLQPPSHPKPVSEPYALEEDTTLDPSSHPKPVSEPYALEEEDPPQLGTDMDYHIYISNQFQPESNVILKTHCESTAAGGAMDEEPLPAGGTYQWDFPRGTAMVFCSLRWSGGHRSFDAYVDADLKLPYNNQNDTCTSSSCLWAATEDGIYLYDQDRDQFMFKCKWDN